MCVVEKKTYVHSNGRREIVDVHHRCHRAVGNNLCGHVEHRNGDNTRIVEVKPSFDTQSSVDGLVVTEGATGRKTYRPIGQRRDSTAPTPNRGSRSGMMPSASNSPATSSPISIEPTYREVKPSSASTSAPSSRPQSTTVGTGSQGARMTVGNDGTAYYGHPPSLSMARAANNERATPSSSRPTSYSSTAADVQDNIRPDDIYRRPGRSNNVSGASSPSNLSSSPPVATPGLSFRTGRSDSANNVTTAQPQSSQSKGKQPVRDSGENANRPLSDAEIKRLQQAQAEAKAEAKAKAKAAEDERQAQIERDRSASTDRRQLAREAAEVNSQARRIAETEAAAVQARKRAEQNRRAAAAALEGDIETQRAAEAAAREIDEQERRRARARAEADAQPDTRRRNAELKQMARERATAEVRDRDSASDAGSAVGSSFARPALLPASAAADPRASPTSARSPRAPASPYSARITTPYNVVLHQPSNTAAAASTSVAATAGNTAVALRRHSSIRDRGNAVIDRLQGAAAVASAADEEARELAAEEAYDAEADAGRRAGWRERRRRTDDYHR